MPPGVTTFGSETRPPLRSGDAHANPPNRPDHAHCAGAHRGLDRPERPAYAGDATHHLESHQQFIEVIKEFCTAENNAALHALYTDTNRRSLDIERRKKRLDFSSVTSPVFDMYKLTAAAGRQPAPFMTTHAPERTRAPISALRLLYEATAGDS